MIIHQVELLNFGIYGGEWVFDLSPVSTDQFNRPVILIKGNNGAGKTTLVEAIRLCLHGSLALGSRVSRTAYEEHLAKRIHLPLNSLERPTEAKVSVVLEHVSEGRKHTYRIERSWRIDNDRHKEDIEIWEDDEPVTDLKTTSQKDGFLRELVPVRVADLFFFDGEKLQMLMNDEAGNHLLGESVNMLLGLRQVEQLQTDLNVYLSRQMADDDLVSLKKELDELTQERSALEVHFEELEVRQAANKSAVTKLEGDVATQMQLIASEGNWFAEQLDALEKERDQLTTQIELLRRQAHELANGLVPFAVTPRLCRLVQTRLHLEKDYEEAVAVEQVVNRQVERISERVTLPGFWAEIEAEPQVSSEQKLLSILTATLREERPSYSVDPQEIILRVSDPDRQTLLAWIDQALEDVPRQFCRVINQINVRQKKLEQVLSNLQRVPEDESLKPLVQRLYYYQRELETKQKETAELTSKTDHTRNQLEQNRNELKRIHQQLVSHREQDQRIQLAARAQLVLEDYAVELRQEKLSLLEEALTRRFNELSHKETLIDAAEINPATFKLTLYRRRQPFERNQLSAGEKQILAVALMWALREVSRVPMPIIIDTPLGRLDREHRLNIINSFFPRASQQVVLLATDTEIDQEMLAALQPAISHSYQLDYEPGEGKTEVYRLVFADDASYSLEEVAI